MMFFGWLQIVTILFAQQKLVVEYPNSYRDATQQKFNGNSVAGNQKIL